MRADDDLVANLESPLPETLQAGVATALFCVGTCFHRRERIARLEIAVDGVRHLAAAFAMPRPDVRDVDPAGHRSGWWGTVPVPAPAGEVELCLIARLASGTEVGAPLARIPVAPREPGAARREPGLIAVCMGTFEPDIALLERQLESLRAQTDRRWVCVISDDGSAPERWEQVGALVAGDERFTLSRSDRRQGFYGNFERALRLAPPQAGLIALCDQDDVWHPDKLAELRAALGDAQLVYCDQRLVDADGRVLRDTLWRGRRNNHTSLASLLIANTVTGGGTLLRREVADLALPFPDAPGVQFHDHWLALVALATGDIAYVDRPLYDYVQHRAAVFGAVGGPRRRWLLRGGRSAYFLGYVGRAVLARTLLARCRMTARKRRTLRRFVAAEHSWTAFAWLAARPLRALAGRTETLGTESQLAHGLLWRRVVSLVPFGDTRFPADDSFRQPRLERWRAGA